MTVSAGREGGCQCTAIRYRLLRAPLALYACHCLACQKQSASAFGMSMWMERDGIAFEGDPPREYHTRGDSGRAKICAFCGRCGTRLYHESTGSGILSVKAGSLDDTSDLVPTAHIWTTRAQPWTRALIDSGLCFRTEPEDEGVLPELWRRATSAERAR